jgi:hypothetical protein
MGLAPRHQASDVGAAAGRMLRALVRRAGDGDLIALEELASLQRASADAVASAARALHDGPYAYSWGEIGAALGVTRQSAHERFAGGAE